VTLIDLDATLVQLFTSPGDDMPARLSHAMLALNGNAFKDPRVKVIHDDAFNGVDKLIASGMNYDAIIVDLPDPSHPDLNKLYSDYFYRKLKELISNDGALTVQSTSPYHAQKAFISVGKTLALAGFNVKQYHHNVPSFGEWGWSIATLSGKNAQHRLAELNDLPLKDDWLTLGLVNGAFEFPANFYQDAANIKPNELGSLQLYHYHLQAWSETEGLTLF
ncbi:MAG: polyamine aminopropyltransferase, partial [Shewanella sp.]